MTCRATARAAAGAASGAWCIADSLHDPAMAVGLLIALHDNDGRTIVAGIDAPVRVARIEVPTTVCVIAIKAIAVEAVTVAVPVPATGTVDRAHAAEAAIVEILRYESRGIERRQI